MGKRLQFIVEVEQPEGATVKDVRDYIWTAVGSWKGSLHPPGAYGDDDDGDPMFGLDGDSVKVKRYIPKEM